MGSAEDEVEDKTTSPPGDIKSRIQRLNYQGDLETAKQLRNEGRKTVDHQLDAIQDIDEKAARLLRFNVLIIGLILSVLAIVSEFNGVDTVAQFGNNFTIGGIVLFLLSALVAAVTYTASDTEGGFEHQAIHNAIDADLTEEEFYVGAASSYAKWIKFNDEINKKNAFLITLTSLLLSGGLIGVSLGAYNAHISDQMYIPAIGTGLVLLVFVWYSGILEQFLRVYGDSNTDRSLPSYLLENR